MAAMQRPIEDLPGIVATPDDPVLVLEMRDEAGQWLTWYVRRSDFQRMHMSESPDPERRALLDRLSGVWSDIDADEMLDALDRIRHANPPTPPIGDP